MAIVSWAEALALLLKAEVVALPTETVYGLAARIDSEVAVKKIFTTKARPYFDPLIIHVAHKEMAKTLSQDWNKLTDHLTQYFWPGPLTVLTPKNPKTVSDLITAGKPEVALRQSAHPLFQKTLEALQVALAAPSANKFGKTSPTQSGHLETEYQGSLPVLDGGPCSVGMESTIVRCRKKNQSWVLEILRPGGLAIETLTDALSEFAEPVTVISTHSQAAPGQLASHYQPTIPLVLVEGNPLDARPRQQWPAAFNIDWGSLHRYDLGEDAYMQARCLYADLRRMDTPPAAGILIYLPNLPSRSLWPAIHDRLKKAAKFLWSEADGWQQKVDNFSLHL